MSALTLLDSRGPLGLASLPRLWRSLRAKIFGAILLGALLPLTGAGWLIATATENALRQQATQDAYVAGALVRTVAEERARRLLASAQAIALTPGLAAAVAARDRETLLRLTRPAMDNLGGPTIAITDEQGTIVLRTYAPERFGDDVAASTKGLRPALRGQAGYSTERAGLRGLALRAFAPIIVEGRLVGVAAVTQNLDHEFLGSLREAVGFDTFALAPDGTLVGSELAPELAERIRAAGTAFAGPVVISGREHGVYAWQLNDPDGEAVGSLGIVLRFDELDENRTRLRNSAIVAGLLAVLGSIGLAWVLSRLLVEPLERIAQAARGITRGGEQEMPHVGGSGELAELGQALATMVDVQTTLRKDLAEQLSDLARLHEMSTSLPASLDLTPLLQKVLGAVLEMQASTRGVVMLRDRERNDLVTVASVGFSEEYLALVGRVAPGVGACGIALAERRRVSVADVNQDPAFARHREEARLGGYRAVFSVPLVTPGGEVIGTLATYFARPYQPSEREARLIELYAAHAATLIEHARLYQETREALRDRDEFLSVAAHELKTPVTSLRGFAQLTAQRLEKMGTIEPARLQQALLTIDQQSEKLSRLVSQLLDISRIDAGRLALETTSVDLAELARDVVSAAQVTSPRHTISARVAGPVPALVDGLRLEQVLTNLVENAVKYSPDGGPVVVELTEPDPETVRLSVRDAGVGIAPHDRPRIFERFFQGRSNRPVAGMGLGLFISRQIVELHGGHIEAEFPSDGGTRVIVTLPRGVPSVPGAAEAPPSAEAPPATEVPDAGSLAPRAWPT